MKLGLYRDRTVTQRSRDSYDFEGGVRVVSVSNNPVAPRIRLRRTRIIWIKGRKRGHSHNFAGARTHHDAGGAHRRIFLHRFGKFTLQNMLQTGVESENDIVTVARVNILVPVRRQFAGMNHFRAPPPWYSCECVIEHFLDPGSPDRFYVRLLIGSTLFGADK